MNAPGLADRLADVQVRVRADLKYTRQVNRDGVSYIVHHPVTFQNHRLSTEDYLILSQLRESRTLSQSFQQLVVRGLLAEKQREDFYRFVVHLNQLHLLRLPMSDAKQLHDRFVEKTKKQRTQTAKSFLFFRIPLFQPMAFLDRTLVFVRPMFSRPAAVVWLAAMLFCASLIVRRWSEFSDPLGTMLATNNFVVLWILLLGLKVIHEFGHAYACRTFGAKVPEMGAFFLMGSPCAYVDASDSWNLSARRHRLIVAMGGMYFESWFAMAAVVVWSMTEPSLLNSIAQYVVVLSTVVTIGFNANPLMRYDGYYALTDILGRPLLREDAAFEFTRIVKRVLFGLQIETRTESRTERLWLIAFGIACSVYRLLIAISIATVLGMFVPMLGSLVLVAYIGSTVVKLVKNGVEYLRTSEEISDRRPRAYAASMAVLIGTLVGALMIPVPGGMRLQGVVTPQHEFIAYATAPGFLSETNVTNGSRVTDGAILCRLENADIDKQVESARAQVRDLELKLTTDLAMNDRASVLTRQQLTQARELLANATEMQQRLTILSPAQGTVSQSDPLEQTGRYIKPGEPLARVASGDWCVTTVLDEETFSDARPDAGSTVQLRIKGTNSILTGRVVRIRTLASDEISVPQLTHLGGGDIPVSDEQRAQRPYVEVQVLITGKDKKLRHGQRALVRLGSSGSTIATVCLRNIRRLFDQL